MCDFTGQISIDGDKCYFTEGSRIFREIIFTEKFVTLNSTTLI